MNLGQGQSQCVRVEVVGVIREGKVIAPKQSPVQTPLGTQLPSTKRELCGISVSFRPHVGNTIATNCQFHTHLFDGTLVSGH